MSLSTGLGTKSRVGSYPAAAIVHLSRYFKDNAFLNFVLHLKAKGGGRTVYDRFRRYKKNGMFDRIVERLHLELDKDGYIDWQLRAVDSTVIRAHKSAAGAGKKGEQSKSRKNLQTMP
ncbi:hypothetical protein [Nafulsella turpanensis]|uniref:hypothetical protein n=1 Tax=Nafulsella turpanensis TaxID=1265690 RepID=UPI0003796EFC|nr:hypothetical protein [Nafulsella turpanensis]